MYTLNKLAIKAAKKSCMHVLWCSAHLTATQNSACVFALAFCPLFFRS
jgi:hypothetical protein